MKTSLTFKIYNSTTEFPENWNDFTDSNIFLNSEYLKVLEESAPRNMNCHFIGFFKNEELIGIALAQFLNINKLETFGERDQCTKTLVRNIIFRNFGSHVLFIGNNMLTGQNAFNFSKNINPDECLKALKNAIIFLKNHYRKIGKNIHLVSIKDFEKQQINTFLDCGYQDYYKFSTQPNMVLPIRNHWKSIDDYISDINKKYRDQYKRARKKSELVIKKRFDLNDIKKHEASIMKLYYHVARNAPFNTFFLSENHFSKMKEYLKDDFLLYGYFENDQLIGFNTLIRNGTQMDTYFLGYDEEQQKNKMLYLNMLYDMIAYSIKKGFSEIIFARTALEIKSSVGAIPIKVYGLIEHNNRLINKKMDLIFSYLEPKVEWKQRNPFK